MLQAGRSRKREAGDAAGVPADEEGARLARSRDALLSSLGDSADVTFVRSAGNLGDELIWAGTRRLLSGRASREVGLSEALGCRGEVAVLAGGGAWCAPYHELLPSVLGSLEERFGRVVVFPSSFDPAVPEVRAALSRSRAIVFAREEESYGRIRDLCEARLADDAALFFDYAPWRREGKGVLNAYRTDRESSGAFPLPAGNRDLSVSCSSLDEWLWTIARHAEVRTDRAHVMIAAALLGKRVRYRPSAYFKLPAIAAYSLGAYDVARDAFLPDAPAESRDGRAASRGALRAADPAGETASPANAGAESGAARVTAVILTTNRPALARAAARSVLAHAGLPCRVLLVPNGSPPEVERELDAFAAPEPLADCLPLVENLGCAGGRALAAAAVETEFVLFLDDDAEIRPGAVACLVRDLDANPAAIGATPAVVLPSGAVQHCGGDVSLGQGVLSFRPSGTGLDPADPRLGGEGATAWLPGTAALIRLSALLEFPIDPLMKAYYEDNEWSWRVARSRRSAFRRVPGAVVLHRHEARGRPGNGSGGVAAVVPYLEAIARFRARHGHVLDAVFGWLPELQRSDGSRDVAGAAVVLDALADSGSSWFLEAWRRAEGRGDLLVREARARRDTGTHPGPPGRAFRLRELPARLRHALALAAGLGEG